MATALDVFVSFCRVVERKAPVDHGRPDAETIDHVEQAGEIPGAAHGRTEEVELGSIEVADIHRGILGGIGTEHHQAATRAQGLHRFGPATDGIEDKVEPRSSRRQLPSIPHPFRGGM